MTTDARIDAYIARSADFAKPILGHLRNLVHQGCPKVKETIKWGFPHFDHHGILCSMASFKKHCAFGFWKASLMDDPKKKLSALGEAAMGNFGQLTKLSDLPGDKVMLRYIKEAVRLNAAGVKVPRKKPAAADTILPIPDYFRKALVKNKRAAKIFEKFSHSNKKEYVDWVTEAKTEETRNKRLATALEWMAEGKPRNWKYQK